MHSLTSTFKPPVAILRCFNTHVIYSNAHTLLKRHRDKLHTGSLTFFFTILHSTDDRVVVSTITSGFSYRSDDGADLDGECYCLLNGYYVPCCSHKNQNHQLRQLGARRLTCPWLRC